MDQDFNWNPYADQPHNVVPKKQRFWYHFRFAPGYLSLLFSNVQKALPVISRYRKYKRAMYKTPFQLQHPFGVAVSPFTSRNEEVLNSLEQLGVQKTLVRIPSWERERLDHYEDFIGQIKQRGLDIVISLLQRREDVRNSKTWEKFLDDVFSRFKPFSSWFEIGHAWNRTKWGVWDYREYLRLAEPSIPLAQKHGVNLIGPAVIDFEFHLYPVVLKRMYFDRISSLLYVDRVGAPENAQYGWSSAHKVALLRAVVDACVKEKQDIWITEMNWPIAGTGKYSPAVGRMNVSEEEQANYLVRYFILCLSTGFVDRIYWWQLVAPGYGLIDSRSGIWRERPSFFALKSMVERIEGSIFEKKLPHPAAFIFLFRKQERSFAVCWTQGSLLKHTFSQSVLRIENLEGEEVLFQDNRVQLGPSPQYVYFR
ncbi:MAG: hypothetical protein JSV17_03745 [Candidatus Aminicenantes bacterium]|nr:MAG: hypothetical protein JSV17_03745 [Candidatus Aminicenantes bacterium]